MITGPDGTYLFIRSTDCTPISSSLVLSAYADIYQLAGPVDSLGRPYPTIKCTSAPQVFNFLLDKKGAGG